jgi:hypothetical protein
MISDEDPYMPVHRLVEAGALIGHHMGLGAVHEAIEAAVEYSDVAEGDEDKLEGAFLVGFGEGVSRKAFQDNGPEILASLEERFPLLRADV